MRPPVRIGVGEISANEKRGQGLDDNSRNDNGSGGLDHHSNGSATILDSY